MLSFVVPAYNAERTLERCLASIFAQDLDAQTTAMEVLVVDNNSSDSTRETALRFPVRLLSEPRPGAAAARNRGIAESKGERIALVDSDCEIPRDWARRALRAMAEEGASAVGGPGRLPPETRLARCLNGLHYGRPLEGKRRFVRSLATMDAIYEGSVLRQNMFDTAYYWAEDAELNLRLVEAGHRLLFDPNLTVIHHHPTTLAGILRKWYEYGLQYPAPYLRRGRILSDPGFLPRLSYIPFLLVVLVLGSLHPVLWIAAVAFFLVLPLAYFLLGLRVVHGFDRLLFPLLHTLKQWAQMLGMLVGTLVPSQRNRRKGDSG